MTLEDEEESDWEKLMGNGDCAELIGANSRNHANSHTLDGEKSFYQQTYKRRKKCNKS